MSVQVEDQGGLLPLFSDQLARAVERAGASIVRVEARRRQAASGVAWAAEGVILTADHVLEREEDLSVGLPDGETVAARILGRDPGTDIALLKVEGASLTPIEQGPSPKVGHLGLIVARPGDGLETSIGVVSALGGPARTRRGGQLEGFIRTDAEFYPGFSGGPLVDTGGTMIGLATSRFSQGAGLAIPLETVRRVTTALTSHGRVRRGFLGLSSQPVALPEALRTKHGLSQESGLLVVGVESGGPAEQAGLMMGDVLLQLGVQPVHDTDDLRNLLSGDRVGQATPARVLRGGEPRDLTVTIGERK
ncbi:MAG: trypsin-like peptidase domain-containing protein [Chloroflexi bacterium]|nr:trypsin-like peptidase domain-containing protein [Chloroflexota bacterium]